MKNEKLNEAVKLVNEAIAAERKRLEGIVNGVENDPIMVEGVTITGYHCDMMVDPKEVARIVLKYDFPVWKVLEEDAPEKMWVELGETFGLKIVTGFDL